MNNRKYLAMATTLALFAASVSAQADGFYAGGSIGKANLSEDFDGLVIDDNSTAYRIYAGWRFNDYFALEGGYQDFGDFQQVIDDAATPVTAKLSADGFVFGAEGNIPVSERFALTGRAGMFFWDGNAEINNVSQARPEDTNLYLGAGVRFSASEKVTLTGDWTRYELESAVSGVFSVGLQYQFR